MCACLLDVEEGEVVDACGVGEEALGLFELLPCSVRVAGGVHDPGGEQVGAGALQVVFCCLEQSDRPPGVAEGDVRAAFHLGEAGERPVQTDAHVRIVARLAVGECVAQHLLGAGELAGIAQRVAEQDAVARLLGGVVAGELPISSRHSS